MPKVKNPIKPEDIKLGSDDMVFWQKIISAHEAEEKTLKDALKLTEKILKMAGTEYEKAEKEFNS